MDILFVWTGPPDIIYSDSPKNKLLNLLLSKIFYSPRPILFHLLRSLTSGEHSVDIIQVRDSSDVDFSKKYDIVGITCITRYAFLSYKIADEFRKNGSFVVLGGYHPSALPWEAKQHADAVFIGEAEDTWPLFLKEYELGKPRPFYIPTKPVDLNKINLPMNIDDKGKQFAIYASRGCPVGCEFCAISNMRFGRYFRKRNINKIIEEINAHSGKYFVFRDSSLTIDPNFTKKLFKAMVGINKKFVAMGNINVLLHDDELLKLSQEAGCIGWLIGFESVNQESINEIGKITNKVDEYISAVKKIHDYGITVDGTFVFGFDHDTPDIFDKTYDFVQKSEIDRFLSMILTPYPGTPLFERLEREGRILTKNWDKYNMEDVVFKPKNMTPEELYYKSRELHEKAHQISIDFPKIFKSTRYDYYAFRTIMMDVILSRLIRY